MRLISMQHESFWFSGCQIRVKRTMSTFLTSQSRNFCSVLVLWLSFRAKGLHLRFQNRNFTSSFWRLALISRDRAAPSPRKCAFQHTFVRPACAIPAGGCTGNRKSHFTTRLCVRHARSVQRLHRTTSKHFTTRLWARCARSRQTAARPQNKIRISPHLCAPDTHDLPRRSGFVTRRLTAPAALRGNLEELGK